jgi:hypothetical protein
MTGYLNICWSDDGTQGVPKYVNTSTKQEFLMKGTNVSEELSCREYDAVVTVPTAKPSSDISGKFNRFGLLSGKMSLKGLLGNSIVLHFCTEIYVPFTSILLHIVLHYIIHFHPQPTFLSYYLP